MRFSQRMLVLKVEPVDLAELEQYMQVVAQTVVVSLSVWLLLVSSRRLILACSGR
jgi:ABC-type nickel/cobalt efflux system permease component RcnA